MHTNGEGKKKSEIGCTEEDSGTVSLYSHHSSPEAAQFSTKRTSWPMISPSGESDSV